jgi:molybdate-binding protein/DNA-binding transcriptional regulator YhcF (GntR family)
MKQSESFLYQVIAEALRRRIASGELKPGEKLPPVREMAGQWNCTPGTVSRAYTQLAREGLVTGHRGGGTRVAPGEGRPEGLVWQWALLVNRAEQLVLEAVRNGYTPIQIETALSVALARWQEAQRQGAPQIPTESEPNSARLCFAGSHDLIIELMAGWLTQDAPEAKLSIDYRGSLGGLMALAQQEADLAGTHLWDEVTDSYNLPFIRLLLASRQVVVVTLAHRSLGLITPPGNPQGLQSLADLTKPGVRLVNRQPGSGTRVWLDAQLKALKLPPEAVPGYEREELTHLAVASAIEQGEATVGLGIHAAAASYGLDFIPLAQERYDLVFSETAWHSPLAQTLLHLIRSSRFKEAVTALGGYDTRETGQIREASALPLA